MKRLVTILLAGAIGAGSTAAVAVARAGDHEAPQAVSPGRAVRPAAPSRPSEPSKLNPRPIEKSVGQPDEQPAEEPAAAPCDADTMLPVISEAIQIPYDGMFWESVDIAECQNGYARVFAITGGTPPPGTQLEGGEQAFLQDLGGEWKMLSSGSGLDCYPGSMPPDLEEACEALGLP